MRVAPARPQELIRALTLIPRPQSGRRQLENMPVRIAEIDALAAARPFAAAFDGDVLDLEPLLPSRKPIGRDRKGDMHRPVAVMRRDGTAGKLTVSNERPRRKRSSTPREPTCLQPRAGDQGPRGEPHMLKVIHAQESRDAADRKARAIVDDLRAAKMNTAADLVERSVSETLTYYAFPDIHWQKIRTNNPPERIMNEIRRRTRVVGAFPDGQPCLNLAAARLRYIAGTAWSAKST